MSFLFLSLLVSILSATELHATTIDFSSQDRGPSNPLEMSGITVSTDSIGGGRAATAAGVGLGNDSVGLPGFLDTLETYGLPEFRSEGLELRVNGRVNSFTIRPFITVEDAPVDLPFKMFVLPITGDIESRQSIVVDPARPSTISFDDPDIFGFITAPQADMQDALFEYWNRFGRVELTFWYGFSIESIDYSPQPVPEPGSLLLLVTGFAGLAGIGRRFRKE
jgi:hypothetical protein